MGTFSAGGENKTLILRLKGGRWTTVASPDPGSDNNLFGVTATSAGNAWAAGDYISGGKEKTLILRWNGAKWTKVASPSPGVPSGVGRTDVTWNHLGTVLTWRG